jgi:hypothetical protein
MCPQLSTEDQPAIYHSLLPQRSNTMRARYFISTIAFLLTGLVHGQWALGTGLVGVHDNYAGRTLLAASMSAEFRVRCLPAFVCRAGLTASPMHIERYSIKQATDAPVPRTWISHQRELDQQQWGVALDLKYPFGDTLLCAHELYRGTYTTFGLAWNQYTERSDVRNEDQDGTVRTYQEHKNWGAPVLRVGYGGEWNLPWGCPFAEVQVGVGGKGLMTTMAAVVGFRYVFYKRPVPKQT